MEDPLPGGFGIFCRGGIAFRKIDLIFLNLNIEPVRMVILMPTIMLTTYQHTWMFSVCLSSSRYWHEIYSSEYFYLEKFPSVVVALSLVVNCFLHYRSKSHHQSLHKCYRYFYCICCQKMCYFFSIIALPFSLHSSIYLLRSGNASNFAHLAISHLALLSTLLLLPPVLTTLGCLSPTPSSYTHASFRNFIICSFVRSFVE